jgi:N-acetylmuramic acid 6-phosphate etherase
MSRGITTGMSDTHEKAREFLEHQQAFRLGELLTEASHPKTRRLSATIQTDLAVGLRLLQSVDDDIPAALDRIFAQDSFAQLIEALEEAIRTGRRIFFTGCGATGRLSILLEAAWRRLWREGEHSSRERPAPKKQGPAGLATHERDSDPQRGIMPCGPRDALATGENARREDLCISVMAGGDFALIKSVEGFEDFPEFGRRQLREAGVGRDDVVVAITEGGETPFVIGTAWEGLAAGAQVFFVYNNPTDLLRRHVQRSREVLDEPRIHKLDLATGPMAITGSTRMQATTTELLVVGAALETAVAHACVEMTPESAGGPLPAADIVERSPQEYHQLFATLLEQLSRPPAVGAIARLVELEEEVYRRHGLVTYGADSLLLDILTDTTERAPTFMLPPFRKQGDTVAPVSWAFVKNSHHPTQEAWADMLQRQPRGLTWGPEVYRALNAPLSLQTSPPKLDNEEIYRFRIGNEPDPSRVEAPDSLLVLVGADPHHPSSIIHHQYRHTAALTFGPGAAPPAVDEQIHIACDLPASPLRLWEHLALKLILNTLSTATMVRMGRVIGNAMVWVSPSNKKLIDRGCRLIAQQTGSSYERACEVLHEAMEETARRARAGEEVPSPVALAIERLGTDPAEKTT